MLRPNELLIDDDPIDSDKIFHPTIDGERKGMGCVPRDYAVQPRTMFSPPSEITLIPRSEWSARIQDKIRGKSQISDILLDAGIPSLDQGQVGYCHTADTEVLTDRGYVMWPDYNWSDLLATVNPINGAMEFQAPLEKHVYDYDGEMIYSTNRRVNFGVTPDHQMYVRKWDERERTLSKNYSFVRAGDLGWYSGLMHAPNGWAGTELVELEIPGDRRYDGDDFLAILGLIVSDGYAGGTEKTRNWVSFASFRDDIRDSVQALAARTGFHECPGKPGVFIRYDAGSLAAWLRANAYTGGNTGAHAKRTPDIVKVASTRQIGHFLHWFDDRNRSGRQFYSTSKRLIDDLQELHLRIGKRSSIGEVAAKDVAYANAPSGIIHSGKGYVLVVAETNRLHLDRKGHIERDRYKGLVYCAAVPNHTLITRRNGTTLISSNCWAHSTVGCVQALRAVNNAPYVPLSAYAVAATIKHGADEGAWGALSAEFVRDRGVPAQSIWPQGDRNYRQYDKPETWENAKLHRSTEDWTDLTRDVYDRNLTFDMVASLLLSGIPVVMDENWWSHSIFGCDLVEVEPGSFGVRIRNSWGDGWGDKGFGVLRGSKCIPDGAVAVRVTNASLT